MKKRQLFLYALSLSVSAAAFGGVSVFADSDYSSQTITAKVTDIDGSSVDLQAVSYTHLDVYKRQGPYTPKIRIPKIAVK